jgi:beta-glucuronidase
MKELNCVFTRVHWPQDRRVLDYCDRNGILIQTEVPSWGPDTFKGMTDEPLPAIMNNALEQLREMIARDRNHPSIFCWGLCNEVNGQNPAAKKFVRRMAQEARKVDKNRLLTYASNSLQKTPENDIAGELDFISWNEYYESWYKGTAADVRKNVEEIRKAFPRKMLVVSEYGYCECAPGREGGDKKRLEILREHNAIYREFDEVGGLIFFCYNDYRTHIGDKGLGVMKQRVHGVVDLYGARKPSFEELRRESSPIEALEIAEGKVTVRTRKRIPAHKLQGYKVRWTVYGFGDLPMEQKEAPLPALVPGESATVAVSYEIKDAQRVQYDVMRPTGFSAFTAVRT